MVSRVQEGGGGMGSSGSVRVIKPGTKKLTPKGKDAQTGFDYRYQNGVAPKKKVVQNSRVEGKTKVNNAGTVGKTSAKTSKQKIKSGM